jgi:hypothetical protein
MEKYFLNILFVFFSIEILSAQQLQNFLLDTVIKADEVYLDPVNQIYVINNSDKSITKYDLHFKMLKRISFNQGWDHAVMDVSDPFKSILFYPGDYKISVLDESLSIIASYNESELNDQSTVCQFSTDYIGLFSNNVLKLKNYEQQIVISSEPLFNVETVHLPYPHQLKQSNEYLYLLRPGIGILRYTNQLFEEKKWLNATATKMDVTGDQLFYISDHDLIKFDTNFKTEEIILKAEMHLKSFAVNSSYLVYLTDDHLKIIKWR